MNLSSKQKVLDDWASGVPVMWRSCLVTATSNLSSSDGLMISCMWPLSWFVEEMLRWEVCLRIVLWKNEISIGVLDYTCSNQVEQVSNMLMGWGCLCLVWHENSAFSIRTRKVFLRTNSDWSLLVSNWKMDELLRTIASKRSRPFIWCWGSGEELWSRLRPLLGRKLK